MTTDEKQKKESTSEKTSTKDNVPKSLSKKVQSLQESIGKLKEPEEKIAEATRFMKESLSEPEGPRLKDFWDAKNLCAPLFKEQMNPIKRNHLWSEFSELNQEAKRLKEIIDEQTAFAIEQIDFAIEALEADFNHYDELVKKTPHLEFPKNTKKLIKKKEVYQALQQELHFLKTLVSRLDALRKEVIQTEMRISVKNKLLKRLSKIGDHVFPKRKTLIKEVSDHFAEDIHAFVKEKFVSSEEKKETTPYYILREDIKSFQALAKMLTLNTQVFNKTRKMLSECWDQIKEGEKEKRKEYEEKSKEYQENQAAFEKKIQDYQTFCSKEENLNKEDISTKASELLDEMRTLLLSRDGVKELKNRIQETRKEALSKIQEKLDKEKTQELEKVENFKKEIKVLIEKEDKMSLEELVKGKERLLSAYQHLGLPLVDQHFSERHFSQIQSFILDKKEKTINELSDFETLLEERESLLHDVKLQAEIYRKEMGGSGLDFEKAMIYRELYDSAKMHLDKELEAVDRIQETIEDIES